MEFYFLGFVGTLSNDNDVLGFVCLDYVVFYCLIDNHDSACVGAFCTSDPLGLGCQPLNHLRL